MKALGLFLVLLLVLPSVYAIDYFTDRMNFPPGESRSHKIEVYNSGNTTVTVNVTVPTGFTAGGGSCAYPAPGGVFVCTLFANTSNYAYINSPSNCTEGTMYTSNLIGDNSFSATLTYVCIPDNKIVDCKVEYGHGDANYLSELYISNETATIFNLIRIWNIGQYLAPDEDARNATVKCQYENLPVRTYGRVEIDYGVSVINGTFWWDLIEGGYWFRIGVVSQDVGGKSIGNYYNISCDNLTYQFAHEQVIAPVTTCDLEIRTTKPFTFTLTNSSVPGKSILTISNTEKYKVYDISFDRLYDYATHAETYQQLNSGQSVSYLVDTSTACNSTLFFIPSWYVNSWHPIYYTQQLDCSQLNSAPLLGPIGDQTAYVNITFIFDVNATDAENSTLTFTDNTTLFDINASTGLISFTPNSSQVGNYSVLICVFDTGNASDCETVKFMVVDSTPLVSFDISINTNNDNKSIDLNWTNANADSYIVQWSTNPNNFSNATNLTQTAGFNYTDSSANETRTRYYRVLAVKGGNSLYSSKTGCKHSYSFIANSDTTKGRNYLTLGCNASYTAEHFLQDVPGQTATFITQLNRWTNPELENYQSHPLGSSVNNFTMELGKGYLIFTTVNVSTTITGWAVYNPVTLYFISNSDTTKGRNLIGLPYTATGQMAETFIQGIGNATFITQLNRWTNPELENYQSHPKGSSVNNFTMADSGLGYMVFNTYNETYTPT